MAEEQTYLLLARYVEAGERPVQDGHGARKHPLNRAGRQRLGHLELPRGHRAGAGHIPVDDRGTDAPASVGLEERSVRKTGAEGVRRVA